jgi:peptide/nickel transport system permease protein
MSWASYAAKRVAVSTLVLLGASVLVFSIVRLVPGDPAQILLGQFAQAGSLEALRAKLGLDVPVWQQYFIWLADVLQLNWGESLINGKPVFEMLMVRFPRSLQLAVFALVIAIVISFPLGIVGAVNRNSLTDYVALFFSQVGVSMPSFWLGIIFILVFAKELNVLPPSGYHPMSEGIVENLKHAFMPALALGIINASVFTRYLRSEMLEELNSDYVQTAQAFGHPQRRVVWKYVLRNAMIPTLTVIGIQFGYMLGGIVIIEKVFSYPGVGQLILDGLFNRDYPVIQLGLLVLATAFIVTNLIVDLLYGTLDPKIRY